MSDDANEDFDLGPDPVVTARAGFSEALRYRLELQTRMQSTNDLPTWIVPYLAVSNAARAIEFYGSVFGALLVGKSFIDDSGRIAHAELNIQGTTRIYLSDEFIESGIIGPQEGGGHPVSLVIGVADADLCMAAAVAGGATLERPVQDQWGSRSGWFVDPFGHRWSPTSHTTAETIEE